MTELFQYICRLSLTGSYVVLVVLMARLLLRRCPRRFSYLLWGLVFIRLVCPVFPHTDFSIIPRQSVVQTETLLDLAAESTLSESVAIDMAETTDHSESVYLYSDGIQTKTAATVSVLSWVWIFIALSLLGYHAFSYMRLKRQMRAAREVAPNVYEWDGNWASFVFGIVKPKIYLSSNIGDEERDLILCHEQVHVKRGDHIVKAVCLVIICVHWFNPLAWLSFVLMNQDMEISCDEEVVRLQGEESKVTYSQALLNAAKPVGVKNTGLLFAQNSVKNRVRRVLAYRKSPIWIVGAGVTAILIIAVGVLSDPKTEQLQVLAAQTVTSIDYAPVETTIEETSDKPEIVLNEWGFTYKKSGNSDSSTTAAEEEDKLWWLNNAFLKSKADDVSFITVDSDTVIAEYVMPTSKAKVQVYTVAEEDSEHFDFGITYTSEIYNVHQFGDDKIWQCFSYTDYDGTEHTSAVYAENNSVCEISFENCEEQFIESTLVVYE